MFGSAQIPLQRPAQSLCREREQRHAVKGYGSGRPPRQREALAQVLSFLGADVRALFSGEEAIEVAKDFRPRLVILDLNMPGLDGFETAEQLKQQEWAASSTFVAHTALDRARHAAGVAGFHHFVVKGDASPETFQQILNKIDDAAN
jgi:CheY-like chemotaxis protein